MRGAARFLCGGLPALAFVASACAAPGSGSSAAGIAGGAAGNATAPTPAAVDCDASPGRPVTVFLEGRAGDASPRQEFGKVTFAGPAEPGTVPRYVFTDGAKATHRLGFLDPATGPLPVVPGRTYDLMVESVLGEPSPGALVLFDETGLLLAAASDTAPGRSVMRDGPPGFTVRLLDSGCRGRPVSQCFAERVNAILEVTHEGATVRLGHGQRARLGAYEVACHAAERVKYSPKCADAGVLAISWTIRRVDR